MSVGDYVRGIFKAKAYEAVGYEGSNKPTRWMGRSDGAAPTIGDFVVGDFVSDATSGSPAFWVCTVAGSPGTWSKVGGGGAVLFIGPSAPTGSEQFWYDTDATC